MATRLKFGATARALLALPLCAAAIAHSQPVPDAGTLLREQPKPPAVPTPPPAAPALEKPALKPEAAGPRVLVKAIRIKGNTLIAEAELLAQVQELVGRELSVGQLQNAALILIGYYAQKGYLARVFLPPQDIKNGVVEYQVIEAVRGSLKIERKGERVDAARVERFIDGRLGAGATLDLAELGEALAIVNEQPGVDAKTSLAPGKGEREVDLSVAAADRPLFAANLGANNQGTRATGALQLSAGATLNNPTGRFDALSVLTNRSAGSSFVRADYGLAVADRGLRIGANVSSLRYHLVQSDFAALNATGDADTVGLVASYPLARRTNFNLSLTGGFDYKQLVDRTVAGETGNRRVQVANVGLSGYSISTAGPLSGVLSFGAGVFAGNSDQRNAAALATDQAGRQTQGGYMKFPWNAGLLHPLGDTWTFSGTLRGQVAAKNLDSSERFSLGGASGVRGYPLGEAVGDEGWVGSAALQRPMGDQWTVGGFFDAGGIRVNHSQPAVGAAARNSYGLAAAGLTATWRAGAQTALNFTVATPLGSNPGAQANGNNADGSRRATRVWISLTSLF